MAYCGNEMVPRAEKTVGFQEQGPIVRSLVVAFAHENKGTLSKGIIFALQIRM